MSMMKGGSPSHRPIFFEGRRGSVATESTRPAEISCRIGPLPHRPSSVGRAILDTADSRPLTRAHRRLFRMLGPNEAHVWSLFFLGVSVAAFKKESKIFLSEPEWPEIWHVVGCLVSQDVSLPCLQWMSRGRQPDAKSTNSNADGFVLWPLQHAGGASGSS